MMPEKIRGLSGPIRDFITKVVQVEAGDASENRVRRGQLLLLVLGLCLANLLWTGFYQAMIGNTLFSVISLSFVPIVVGIGVAHWRGVSIDRLTTLTVVLFYVFMMGTTLGAGGRWPGGIFGMALLPAMAVTLIGQRAGLKWIGVTLGSLAVASFLDGPDGSGFLSLATASQAHGAMYRAAGLVTLAIGAVVFFYSRLNEKTNEALRQSLERFELGERRFQAMTENAYDLVAELGEDKCFTYLSPGLEEATGLTPEQLIGQSAEDYIHPDDLKQALDGWNTLLDKGAVRIPPMRFKAPRGLEIQYEVSMRCYEAGDHSLRIVAIARDVSERLERDALVRHQQSLITVGTMAAGAAHQLNDPISSILAASQFALHSRDDHDFEGTASDSLSVIETQTRRCVKILRSMLSFARDEDSERWSEDLHELLHRAVRAIESEVGPLSAEIVMSLCPEAPRVMMSPLEFEQAVINLIRNAVQAQASVIVVGTSIAGRRTVEVSVSDDGIGLSEAAKEAAFDAFYSTHPSARSGLGLTLARRIVEEHFGELDLVETEEGGTVFRIRLPQLRLLAGGADEGGLSEL